MASWLAPGTEARLRCEDLPENTQKDPVVKPHNYRGIKKSLFIWNLLSELSALTQFLTHGGHRVHWVCFIHIISLSPMRSRKLNSTVEEHAALATPRLRPEVMQLMSSRAQTQTQRREAGQEKGFAICLPQGHC